MQRMSGWLDNRQMVVLQNTLDESVKLTGERETEKTTAAIDKRMPIEQVQRLLGHDRMPFEVNEPLDRKAFSGYI